MGRKLSALTGILAAALAFGLGTAADSGHTPAQRHSAQQRTLADGQSPNGTTPTPAASPSSGS